MIDLVAKWTTSILQETGDSPDQPYVLKTAFTGTAASNIGGGTLTTTFGLNFGNQYQGLKDKERDQKRQELKNLVLLIIDEISFVKADDLYRLNLKLQEIKQNKKPFGGVAVFAFGDIFQLRPVCGQRVFERPSNPAFHVTFMLCNLWNLLTVVNLTINHRQGASREFGDLLNRARVLRRGEMDEEDVKTWSSRVRPKGHPDLEGADIKIVCTNKVRATINKRYLAKLSGEEVKVQAVTYMASKKSYTPTPRPDGTIEKTCFMKELCLKVGAKVMMIKNVRTSDSLTNGQLGVLEGVIRDNEGGVKTLMVKFDKADAGKLTRRENPQLEKKFPGATKVDKVLVSFSLAKNSAATANLIQFPLCLAHAVTVHKMQGATIHKPQTASVDVKAMCEEAQGFVAASRVQELSQLFIMEKFDSDKVYASEEVLKEYQRMNARSEFQYLID